MKNRKLYQNFVKNLKKVPYHGTLIKDLKSTLTFRGYLKDIKIVLKKI